MTKKEYADIALIISAHVQAARRADRAAMGNPLVSAATMARVQALDSLVRDLAGSFKAKDPRFDKSTFLLGALGYVPPDKDEGSKHETALAKAFKRALK